MTDTLTLQRQLLTLEGYMQHTGKSERTVRRWLADDRLPGAQVDDRGLWMIPADAVPGAPGSGGNAKPRTAVAPAAPRAAARAAAAPTLPALLAEQPAYLDVDTAARLLGIPAAAIRRNRDRFGAEPFGPHGALVVPQAAVRAIAGIGA